MAALDWVRSGIRAFGGDPERVTVFGQSAGAGCVAALLAMPRARGLFGRAIVQSMPGTYLTPELAQDIARVRGWDAPDLQPYRDRWGLVADRSVPLAPIVDGETLPFDPWRALTRGAASDVGLLAGHTRDEQRLFDLIDGTLGSITEAQATQALSRFAPSAGGARRYTGTAEQRYDDVHSDWLFRMPALHLAHAHTGRTFLYELTWPAPVLGACHGLDVPLVFGNLTAGEPAALLGDDLEAAEAVSAQMRSAWLSFARSGDPGWPPFDAERPLTRVFDLPPAVLPYPEETSRQIWAEHTFAPLPLITSA